MAIVRSQCAANSVIPWCIASFRALSKGIIPAPSSTVCLCQLYRHLGKAAAPGSCVITWSDINRAIPRLHYLSSNNWTVIS